MTTLNLLENILTPTSRLHTSQAVSPRLVDVTRGARYHGIRPESVFLEPEILEDYAEPEPTLGRNAVGSILSALAAQLAVCPGGVPDECVTVSLCRCEDGQAVEVDLRIRRLRRDGLVRLVLGKTKERPAGSQTD